MDVFVEAIFVSIYASTLNIFIKDIFFLGFVKHFLFGILGLHRLYCKYKNLDGYKFDLVGLILESIIEGILFVGLSRIQLNIPTTAFVLHIAFDLLGFHTRFCT